VTSPTLSVLERFSVVRQLGCCASNLVLEIMMTEEEFDGSNVIVERFGK